MATYIPNATQTTEPVESRTVESAALEFRTLKTSINARIEDVQDNVDAVQDNLDAEIVNRLAGDANLQTQNNAQDVRIQAIEAALLAIGEGGLPGTVYVQRLSGTGAQTSFTLNVSVPSSALIDVFINGIYQNKNTFTIVDDVLTFSEAPPAGTDNVEVVVSITIANVETDASLVSFRATDSTVVVRTAQDKMRERVSVKDFGAVGDGVSDDTAAIQAAAALCDQSLARYVYIPNFGGAYKITSPVSVKYPGVRIFGDHGGTYNRGLGKAGWMEGAAGLSRFFDLGQFRTDGNPADHWQVDGLSFKQAAGVTARTVDGVSFTMRQNGPDRGAKIRDCSFIGLKDAITVENPDIATVLGTLDIGGCVFQGCDSALNAKGLIFGLRFVGNQCEQNLGSSGIIRGSINGPATIADNMLEGQANVISIDIPGVTGNRPHLQSRGNYFEANSGDYVHRFRTNSAQASVTVGPNYTQAITATDYVLVENSSGSIYIDVYDDFPVTFKNAQTTLKYGSQILRNRQRAYKVRQVASKPTEVVISDFANLSDVSADHTHVSFERSPSAVLHDTPFGLLHCRVGTTFSDIPLSVSSGDLVALNILCRVSEDVAGNLTPQIWDSGTSIILCEWGGSGVGAELAGKWALVSVAFPVSAASASLRFRFAVASGSYQTVIAGIAAKNYGAFANNGISAHVVTPVVPRVSLRSSMAGSVIYDPASIPDGGAVQTTVTVTGAQLGDIAFASFSNSLQGVILTAYVSSANTVAIWFQNETGAAVDLASGTIRAVVQLP